MIPIRDSIPSQRTPYVNYVVIAICSLVFAAQLMVPNADMVIVGKYAMIPARLTNPDVEIKLPREQVVRTNRGLQRVRVEQTLDPPAFSPWLTLFTCMFLHGGWMHFLGNMWFLYIFGDNVEDRLGHFGFALAYLGTGLAAGLAHFMAGSSSPIPTIGASGAIAGVMGAYAYLYPHAKVMAVLPIFIILQTFILPAPVFLGIWFVMQTISGLGSITGGSSGGVAWWAHIGGFVAGIGVAVLVGRSPLGHAAVTERRF